jgi:AAA domain/Winged helix-turn-helix DNA-binding
MNDVLTNNKTPNFSQTKALENPHLQNTQNSSENVFCVLPLNQWLDKAKQTPTPKMLFGEFWYEGEICVLFADTNVGKSILAVQIADSIGKGEKLGSFALEAEGQKILYFDFELSEKQFEPRYSVRDGEYSTNHFRFSDNFFRAAINPDGDFKDEEHLKLSLEEEIVNQNAKIVIVDNITYLSSENEKAKDALPLMKRLKALKLKYGLSMLVLAHTPKRNMSNPITPNDLQGSKMIMNFCDSSIAIGKSCQGENLRYLKQMKERNIQKIYGDENVCVAQLTKPDNFLGFEFLGFSREREHLFMPSETDKASKIARAKELANEGSNQRDIATELGISLGTVNNYLRQ